MQPNRLTPFAALLVIACGTPEAPVDDLARTASADLSESLLAFTAVHASVTRAESDRSDVVAPVCVDTVGSCTWCGAWDGRYLAGEFAAAPVELPCGGSRSGMVDEASYTVALGWLDGSWTFADGRWTVAAVGAREAVVEIASDERNATFDASWTIESLSAEFDDNGLHSWRSELTYTSYGDQSWVVVASGNGQTIVGTLSGENGTHCTFIGALGQLPEVDCAASSRR